MITYINDNDIPYSYSTSVFGKMRLTEAHDFLNKKPSGGPNSKSFLIQLYNLVAKVSQ